MKTRGRPKKLDKAPATNVLQMRIAPELYEELRESAARNGRSISAQAERRLIHSEPAASDVGRMIDTVVHAIERREGKTWQEDSAVRAQCRTAAEFMLRLILGAPFADAAIDEAVNEKVRSLFKKATRVPTIFSQLLADSGHLSPEEASPSPEEADRALEELSAFVNARSLALDFYDRATGAGPTSNTKPAVSP